MLSKIKLAQTPTPVDELPRLSSHLGGPQLVIKRDDLTGLAFGGNKVRKLEYLLADARDQNADIVLTTGAVQSNHCRQTAAAAAREGLDCTLVLAGEEPDSPSGNNFLDQLLGAQIVWTSPAERDRTLGREVEVLKNAGRNPYLIPYGGSNSMGAFAYAMAVEELMAQLHGQVPDWIVFPSSSGGTQAGLVAGARYFGLDTQILGVSVDEPAEALTARVAELANEAAQLLGGGFSFTPQDILVNDEYIGEGYGVMSDLERGAIRDFARWEGILLDPVYTGRAGGGMLDLVQRGFFTSQERVLFWHTGGTPGLFADTYQSDIL